MSESESIIQTFFFFARMKSFQIVFFLAINVFLLSLFVSLGSSWKDEKVLLGEVKALTLRKGLMTTGRRSIPVPQLKRVGGGAQYEPDVVQCVNVGHDGNDYQWKCSADLLDKYRFGAIAVTCEGYAYPDDPYVLKGSCGLEYELWLTEKGKENLNPGNRHQHYDYDHDDYYYQTSGSWELFVKLIWFGIFGFIIYQLIKACSVSSNPYRGGMDGQGGGGYPGGAGGGLGGQGGNYPNTGYPPYNSAPTVDPSCAPPPYNPGFVPPAPAIQPGFWSGAMGGGLLGYLFGRNTGGYTRPRNRSWFGSYGPSYGSSFGRSSYSSSSYTPSFGSSSSSSSYSSRTASGYGGTRRR